MYHLTETQASPRCDSSAPGRRCLDRSPAAADVPESGAGPDGPETYKKPRIMVIGDVRDLTTGSSSSGNKDANSQYYW